MPSALFPHRPQTLLERAHRREHGGRFVPAVGHAVVAPLVPAPALASPAEPPTTPVPPPPAETDGRFTVQVGAYKAREPAEALRARLAATGHDAYIADGQGRSGTRFRVRVGAQEFAARIAAERSVSTFVTTR